MEVIRDSSVCAKILAATPRIMEDRGFHTICIAIDWQSTASAASLIFDGLRHSESSRTLYVVWVLVLASLRPMYESRAFVGCKRSLVCLDVSASGVCIDLHPDNLERRRIAQLQG